LLEPFAKTDKNVRAKPRGRSFLKAPRKSTDGNKSFNLRLLLRSLTLLHPIASWLGLLIVMTLQRLIRDAVLSSLQDQELAFLKVLWKSSSFQTDQPTREIFMEMLTTSIVRKRSPAELSALLSMIDVKKNLLVGGKKPFLNGVLIQGGNGKWKPSY